MLVGTGKANQATELLEALARGRDDHQYFARAFLNRTLNDTQLEYVEGAEATINCLATSNRWGKTTVLPHVHYHGNIYKTGGEPRYLDPITGQINHEAWLQLRYNTVHTADLWETAALVWDEARKMKNESAKLSAFIKAAPESKPPHIDFIHGSRWKFRTLGHDASGIDGNSFYIISIDEAGWIPDLEEKMSNVIRVRVADVRGRIHIVGTFKPGISRDFYKFCVRASSYTGVGIAFAHAADEQAEAAETSGSLDSAIRKYLREFFGREAAKGRPPTAETVAELGKLGITPDEFIDAIGGS